MNRRIDITTQAYNDCPKLTANSTLNTSSVQFKPNPTCQTSIASFGPNAGVDSNCLVNSLYDRLYVELSALDSQTQKSYGYSLDPANIKSQLTRQVIDTCINESSTVSAGIKDTIITSCDWHFVQNATKKSACVSNALQKIANELSVKKQESFKVSLFRKIVLGDGSIMVVLWRILVILCLIGVIYYLYLSIYDIDNTNLRKI